MRLFFLLLVLMNVAFFLWHERIVDWLGTPAPPERPAVARGEAPPPLMLLSERSAEEARGTPASQRPASSSPSAVSQTSPEPQSPETRSNSTQEAASPAQEAGPAQRPQPEPVRSSLPPAPVASADPPSPPPAPSAGAADVAVQAGRCLEVGPYLDPARAEEARAIATQAGLTATLETAERSVQTGYWLLTEDRYDLAGARAVVQGMSESGISDVAIVSLESGLAISLGLYSRAPAMERRRRELLEAGYASEVRQRFEDRTVHLLRLTAPAAGSGDAAETLLGTLTRNEPRLEWRETACP